jgi:CubicO group peptidase (beta-lactamase class C family)
MSFRAATAELLNRFAMVDSMPALSTLTIDPPADQMTSDALERYTLISQRLARPYSVDSRLRSTPTEYTAIGLTPASGMISTIRDLARFDVALRRGVIVQPESLAAAWTPPLDRNAQRLPHGIGWFAQNYNGERIVWQFGVSDNASSSIIITIPSRGLTLVMLANSSGLSRPFSLGAGDVIVSPFARVFLSIFAR